METSSVDFISHLLFTSGLNVTGGLRGIPVLLFSPVFGVCGLCGNCQAPALSLDPSGVHSACVSGRGVCSKCNASSPSTSLFLELLKRACGVSGHSEGHPSALLTL